MNKNDNNHKEDLVAFAIMINSIDSGEPRKEAIKIMRLYEKDLISFEEAEKQIMKLHEKKGD